MHSISSLFDTICVSRFGYIAARPATRQCCYSRNRENRLGLWEENTDSTVKIQDPCPSDSMHANALHIEMVVFACSDFVQTQGMCSIWLLHQQSCDGKQHLLARSHKQLMMLTSHLPTELCNMWTVVYIPVDTASTIDQQISSKTNQVIDLPTKTPLKLDQPINRANKSQPCQIGSSPSTA